MLEEWITRQRGYLELEREAERLQLAEKLTTLTSQECQELGISLLSLDIESSGTSLFGRVKYKIIRKDLQSLPIHSFKVGDEVELYEYKRASNNEKVAIEGIISKVTSTSIEMVADESDGIELIPPLRLDMRSSEATHIKLVHALNDLSNLENTPAWPVVDLLFSETPLQECIQSPISVFNPNLNESQIDAVSYALHSSNLALIHGPPGTGKTTAVIELILQALACGLKILVCAPSNVAVDNILERLVLASTNQSETSLKVSPRVVRLGHPARVSETIQNYCLDALISVDEGTDIVGDVRKEIDDNRRALSKAKTKKDRALQKDLQSEIRNLRKEIRKREERVVRSIMESRNVILSTLVGASSRQLRGVEFDMVIIDEAAQALEVACWIPILHTSKVVLAGDHCQLPPTIKSVEAERSGLGVTLFERIITSERLGPCARLLDVQYRMNRQISDWSSQEMYHGRLRSHQRNSMHTLRDLIQVDNVIENEDLKALSDTVMLLVDTAGCNMEEDGCRGGSYRNVAEAEIVVAHIYRLYQLGLKPEQIGVITPYNGQLELLRELVVARENEGVEAPIQPVKDQTEKSSLEIRTVDGFQGGEKEAIILSLVRSNENKEVGFLAEKRRINVAVTRAKRHLVIVCDSETCSKDSFISRLLAHISQNGEHRSALEYLQNHGLSINSHPTTVEEYSLNVSVNTLIPNSKNNAPNVSASIPKKKGTIENKIISKQVKKIEAQNKKIQGSGKMSPQDNFSRHVEKLLLALALGKLNGGVIGNGAVRILDKQNFENDQSEKDQLKLYSSLITPQQERPASLLFPSSLNSHQRLTIHNIAEMVNSQSFEIPKAVLIHESLGEGENRKIEVRANWQADNLISENECLGSINSYEIISEPVDPAESIVSELEHTSIEKKPSQKSMESLKKTNKSDTNKKKEKEDPVLKGMSAGLTDEELIEEAIKANAEHANYHKYRLKATPMPNPEKVRASASLRATIQQSQLARGGESRKATLETNKQGNNAKKNVKKPPSSSRNFGGGRLGGGS